jgi:hypothetical protein
MRLIEFAIGIAKMTLLKVGQIILTIGTRNGLVALGAD